MNFMPAELEGDTREAADRRRADCPSELRAARRGDGKRDRRHPPGALRGRVAGRRRSATAGVTFEAEIDVVESLGSELYAYFHVEAEGVQSDQLAELADDRLEETGAAELREGQEQIVARLDPTSKVKRGEEAELWVDTAKLHLFDPESGESLRASRPTAAPSRPTVKLTGLAQPTFDPPWCVQSRMRCAHSRPQTRQIPGIGRRTGRPGRCLHPSPPR